MLPPDHPLYASPEELADLRDRCAQARPPRPRRPRRAPRCRPEDRALITRQASAFGFVATASADTAEEAYRQALGRARAAARAAFEKPYRPTLLRQGAHAVIIWHDPRTSWYGVVRPDDTIKPMLAGEPAEVERAARAALRRLCGEDA